MGFPEEKMPESERSLPPAPLIATEAVRLRADPSWFTRNSFPLAILLLALIAFGNAPALRKAIHGSVQLTRPEASATAPVLDDISEDLIKRVPALMARGALGNISFLVCVGLAIAYAVSPEMRTRYANFVRPAPARLLPASGPTDVGISLIVSLSAGMFLAFLVIPDVRMSAGEYSALVLTMGTMGMLASCAVLILLSVWRAGGWHGARGLLPFWTQSSLAPKRTILSDIGLALVVFALTNGPLLLIGALNKLLVKAAGMKSDQHSLIGELLLPQPTWVLAAFLVAATLGAAFTEEILFRGGIYNACRRYMGRWTAAILAGLIFSAVHFIKSDFLPLFVMGLIMTWLYERTGRLVASMVFHFTNNLISVLTVLALRGHI